MRRHRRQPLGQRGERGEFAVRPRGAAGLLPGPAHARDLLLTGRVVEADEALRLGMVSRVVDPEAFLDDVLATADL